MADTTTTTPPPGPGGTGIDIAAIIDLIRGATGGDTSAANKAADAADPYRGQRSQWFSQITDLMNDPSSILKDPSFQASLNLGLENVSRTAGASGMGLSGNRLASLQQYGQTAGYNAIQTKLGNLEDLAGVKSGSPAAAAAAIQKGTENTKSDLAGGLSGIDKILGQIFGTGAGSTGLIDGFKKLLSGADPSTLDPATLAEINKVLGGDAGGTGLGDFNGAGVTPGGTSGLFGGDGTGIDVNNPNIVDTGIPGGGSTGGDPFGPGATPDPFADGGAGIDWDNVDWNNFDWGSFFDNFGGGP